MRPYVSTLMVIDDLANRRHECDILLDQNYHLRAKYRYKGLCRGIAFISGARYALLREEFFAAKDKLKTVMALSIGSLFRLAALTQLMKHSRH